MKPIKSLLTIYIFFFLNILAYGQKANPFTSAFLPLPNAQRSVSIQMDNELKPNAEGLNEDIHSNPILINGTPLDYETFGLQSRGSLTLVKGDPKAENPESIPFFIQLRRDGNILRSSEIDFIDRELSEIEISDVLEFAIPEDHLIITPVHKKHWKAKRILLIVGRGC